MASRLICDSCKQEKPGTHRFKFSEQHVTNDYLYGRQEAWTHHERDLCPKCAIKVKHLMGVLLMKSQREVLNGM